MSKFQTPVVMTSAPSVATRPTVKRRFDPIDTPARALGAKRLALVMKRADSAALADGRNAAHAATGDSLLVSVNGAVTFLLRKRPANPGSPRPMIRRRRVSSDAARARRCGWPCAWAAG